ncbi:hypothetical protein [Brevibacillus dissolubilis]|uniref:hypothetical protein n=1 Tax=Brevibacillus dissolubilis TaxID=1844116 RepID=UPI001116E934|nr:hypothetical protein [Brevibacillus dissolubilis]
MKDFLRPRMNALVIILVVIALALIDTFVIPRLIAPKVQATPEYRLSTRFSYGELKALVDLINADPAPKVILTGDSVIHGGGVGSGSETISSFLQQDLAQTGSPYHVYNVALSGAAPIDVYFILKSLELDSRDIVVYDLNTGHFTKKPVNFFKATPELASKYHHGESLYEVLAQGDKALADRSRIEDQLQLWVTNTWKLYTYREILNDRYEEEVKGIYDEIPPVNLEPWYKSDWTEKVKNSAKRGAVPVEEDDTYLRFFHYMLETVKEDGARMLVFNIPLNQEMMAQYDMIDRVGYTQNVQVLSEQIVQHGAIYVDYEKLIPSQHFTDSLHPMREGNRIIAQKLQEDIGPWLRGKELTQP